MFSDLFRDSETIRAHHIMLNKNPNIRVGEWLEGHPEGRLLDDLPSTCMGEEAHP